jgi:hypothetical protein
VALDEQRNFPKYKDISSLYEPELAAKAKQRNQDAFHALPIGAQANAVYSADLLARSFHHDGQAGQICYPLHLFNFRFLIESALGRFDFTALLFPARLPFMHGFFAASFSKKRAEKLEIQGVFGACFT